MMKQIGRKIILKKEQLRKMADFFGLGKIITSKLMKKGNINSNYSLTTKDGKYIIRVYNLKEKHEIDSEIAILKLLGLNGFPCPYPIGKEYVGPHRKIVRCFNFCTGRMCQIVDTKLLRQTASNLAKLHLLTTNYQPIYKREGEGLACIKKNLETYKKKILRSRFRKKEYFVNILTKQLGTLKFSNRLPRGIVHVDVKKENILIKPDGKIHLLDFDNAYKDAFVIDIGSTIMWLCFDGERLNKKKMRLFLKEYNKVRRITKFEKKYIYSSIEFNLLKQAFKYAYMCLPSLTFAEKNAYHFIKAYQELVRKPFFY
jgi:homoserine kinase type II